MSFFRIDTERCKRDDICLAVCPVRIIAKHKESGFPRLVPGGESRCIRCSHCVAACPHGALSLEGMPLEECTPIVRSLTISPEQTEQFLRSRRSIRAFKESPVPHKTLAKVLETVRWAPTAKHKQPVHWIVIEDKATAHHIAGLVIDWMRELCEKQTEFAAALSAPGLVRAWDKGHDGILRGAPHLAIAWTDADAGWAESDSAIALSYLELAAHGHGVACCWAGFFTYAAKHYAPLRDFLGLPADAKVCGGQMMGYAKIRYARLPWRKPLSIQWR